LAISKERKQEVVAQYEEWVNRSRAVILTDYIGLSTKELDELRRKVREAGGEFHIVKNTLGKIAFQSVGLPLPEDFFEGGTAAGFAYEDARELAKALVEFAKGSDFLKIKGGYLGKDVVSSEQVKSLAELPPLPVMRAQLLGVIMAPATRLARIVSEPARQVAQVIKAYADQEAAAEPA